VGDRRKAKARKGSGGIYANATLSSATLWLWLCLCLCLSCARLALLPLRCCSFKSFFLHSAAAAAAAAAALSLPRLLKFSMLYHYHRFYALAREKTALIIKSHPKKKWAQDSRGQIVVTFFIKNFIFSNSNQYKIVFKSRIGFNLIRSGLMRRSVNNVNVFILQNMIFVDSTRWF
jgi:hypothetical protein